MATRKAGIIGHPIGHSLSPAFQGAAFKHAGLDVEYVAWDTPAEELAGRVDSLRDPSYLGCNVTIPHKERVISMLDELGGQKARIGAVNTIVNRNGRLVGFNTDGSGFVAALRKELNFAPAHASVLLVGAGGAARGIGFALAEAKVDAIGILNRTPQRASKLADELLRLGPRTQANPRPDAMNRYDCVINCTSLGMIIEGGAPGATELPIDLDSLKPDAIVVDIVYAPEETPLLKAAAERGMRTMGGLPMLIYQGALAFELWTGVSAPIETMFEAARAALALRTSGAADENRAANGSEAE